MTDASTGTAGIIRVTTALTPNAAGNYTDIAWVFSLIENGGSNLAFDTSNTLTASVVVGTVGTVYSGTFSFDWRPAGNQSQVLASGTTRINHNSDGTPPSGVYVTGNLPNTGTSSAGGPTSVTDTPTLSTLKVIPGTPTGVTGTRVSDTTATVSWAETSASNGQPVTNTVQQSVNGGAFSSLVTVAATTSVNVSCAANQKLIYQVKGTNTAGDSAYAAAAVALFTSPAAPTSVVATKTGSDIAITWTDNVAFTEHSHVLEHGTITGGVTTWDGSPLATIAAGTVTYTHTAPSTSFVHVYRLTAKNTNTAALTSASVLSNSVQLLAAPGKPAVATPPAFADKASTFRFSWVHNPVDSSAQTKFQVRYSIDGGTTWTTGSKTVSTNQYLDFAASTWTANTAVTFQVRTKGAYDSGSDGDPSYSVYSDSVTVTFKTIPVATITSPANSSTYTIASLLVALGFSQAESATFVSATIGLYSGATLLEQITSTTLAGTTFATPVANGSSYTVKATVTDSNGLTSAQVSSTFTVAYTLPVAAAAVVTYLPDSGIAQIALTIGAAGGGFVAATGVTIDRTINGVTTNVVMNYPAASSLTILDTTPTINGTNLYTITTISAIGAKNIITASIVTAEGAFAFLSTGAAYDNIIKFWCKPLDFSPVRGSLLVATSGRSRPIGLFSSIGGLAINVSGDITPDSSTPDTVRAFFLAAGTACFRDPFGTRLFGLISGAKIQRTNEVDNEVSFTITETS